MSNVVSGLIVVAVAGLIGAVGLFVRLRVFPGKEDEEREDVAGYVTMMVGVMFALVLALALVSVWEDKDSAEGHVASEASSLNETYLLGASMLPADQEKIQAAASAYAGYVVHTEFPKMRSGKEVDDTGWQLLTNVRTSFLNANVSTPARQAVLSDATTQISNLADARRGRLEDADKRMPSVLWIGLILGGVLTVAMTFIYGIEQRFTHVGMVMGMAAMIGFVLILIYNLDNPFNSGTGADSAPFTSYFP
ncbi:putative integral membrane protein [Catenulispora acidiphila DSM 44928]|uniref:Putative integral membrane protein n=1 Tax=Catenulispora acidiphila (strain DSM 44928 / JCM 14897 / NBRC 102108 / NRRL B-24433 / ID139908) TaxID=479433 RepID=C7Q6B2_CATAD|nr:DUF4239 domain-containing protein [Catenulispora acidiphila]ACU72118.1 putative integral membrane protein [Catenulispora acidiphila DSM 44928]